MKATFENSVNVLVELIESCIKGSCAEANECIQPTYCVAKKLARLLPKEKKQLSSDENEIGSDAWKKDVIEKIDLHIKETTNDRYIKILQELREFVPSIPKGYGKNKTYTISPIPDSVKELTFCDRCSELYKVREGHTCRTSEDKGAMSYSEGDYKQFEELAATQRDIEPEIAEVLAKHGHELFESSEPQEKVNTHSYIPVEEHDPAITNASLRRMVCDLRNENDRLKKLHTPAPVESQEELWKQFEIGVTIRNIQEGMPIHEAIQATRKTFKITRLTP